MSFTLIVTAAPREQESHRLAWSFAKAAVDAGQRIHLVFFYHDAVLVANAAQRVDSSDLWLAWQRLSERHDVPLMLCPAAATRRGLGPDDDGADLPAGFQYGGLVQLGAAMLGCRRVIRFGP